MKKPNIKKLKYPLWFNIVFLLLTVVIPVIFIIVQGFNSPSTIFKVTFTMLCAILLLWIFARKFIINKYEEKLQNRKSSLEHDYEIEVGNPQKAKWLWYSNELILTIVNTVQVLLIGSLIILIAIGIENAAIKVKGLSYLICILYILAYSMKFILLLKLRGNEVDDSEVNNE